MGQRRIVVNFVVCCIVVSTASGWPNRGYQEAVVADPRDSPPTTSTSCSDRCERAYPQTPADHGGSTGAIDRVWTRRCEAHDNLVRCLSTCEESEEKSKLLKFGGMTEWICHESTYRQHAACLSNVHELTRATCERRCLRGLDDDTHVKTIVKNFCSSTVCLLECRAPHVVRLCGHRAKEDETGGYKRMAEYFRWLIVDSFRSPGNYPASECQRLMNI